MNLIERLALQREAGLKHIPTELTAELRLAVAGGGLRAADWADKPHRLVYDACAEIERLTAQVERMREAGSELLRELEWVNEQLDLMPDDYAKAIVRFTAALSYRGEAK